MDVHLYTWFMHIGKIHGKFLEDSVAPKRRSEDQEAKMQFCNQKLWNTSSIKQLKLKMHNSDIHSEFVWPYDKQVYL